MYTPSMAKTTPLDGYIRVSRVAGREGESFIAPEVQRKKIEDWAKLHEVEVAQWWEELELTFNHDGRSYELGTAYGHVAIGVDDLDGTLSRLKEQGIEPERAPYSVREGGSRLCFVQDPDGYRIELIEARE